MASKVLPKRWFLQETRRLTQRAAFFMYELSYRIKLPEVKEIGLIRAVSVLLLLIVDWPHLPLWLQHSNF
jgi:hypothetical protein